MAPVSGLYTRRGLERRARELTADAFRRRSPLACVALGIEPAPKDAPGAVAYAATVLQASARASDAIGDLTEGAFAVLAPATSPEHALRSEEHTSELQSPCNL